MSATRVGVVKGCAIGCGALALIVIVGLVGISVRTWMPLRSSGRSVELLEERYGPPGSFVPEVNGSIPAQSVQQFLEVRRSMQAQCEAFEAVQRQLRRMEDLDQNQSVTVGEVAEAFKGLLDVSTGVAPMIGDYFEKRNRALLEAEMGLGEYTYIFALAYQAQFLDEAIHEELFSEDGPLSPEVATALRAMLTHQRDAHGVEQTGLERRESIDRELEAMQRDPQRLPWQDALPDAIVESLAASHDRLDALFCRSSAGIAMDPDSRRALIIALE